MAVEAKAKRILVVDDDRLIVSMLEAGLEEASGGYSVATAFSAREALAVLQQEKFALVMTDYQMPDMNGVELIKQIQVLSPKVRIVLMSAHSPEMMAEMVGEIRADGYLEKPISIYRMWELVEAVIGES
ncbi:MAG: response regulator [Ardenticatenaceae bacterium]|nr:response regulator [Ardenticatenaceae bacterium]